MLRQTSGGEIIEHSANTCQLGNLTTGYWEHPIPYQWWPPNQITYWQSYPIYVTTDKTKKAIEILKALQDEKLLECKSVPRFIELVEKISNIL